jgi:hypothetical protein
MTTTPSFEPRRYLEFSDQQRLDWSRLHEIFDDLPESLCAQTEIIMDLFDEGACDETVERDISHHLSGCLTCQARLQELRELAQQFEERRSLTVEISEEEIGASFERFLSQYSEELYEPSTEDFDHVQRDEGFSLTVEGPTTGSKKVQAAIGLLFSAALLFAYGPALIEAPINEMSYPSVDLQGGSTPLSTLNESTSSLPLSQKLALGILRLGDSSFKLSQIKPLSHSVTTDVALYGVQHEELVQFVEMTKQKLSPTQIKTFRARLKASQGVTKLKARRAQFDAVSLQKQGDLLVLEYVTDEHHVQWAVSATAPTSLLEELASAHLSELTAND